MSRFDLTGKVAVVTGGGQGIGEGIAKGFAAAGATVVLAARHADRVARVAADIESSGGRALAVPTDVTDRAALEALADAAVETFGHLDVWVNNAGGSSVQSPLLELPESDWDACLALNLTSVWRASVVAAARMSEGGSIINVTSPAATRAVRGSGHYSAAKAGVNALTLTMSVELAPRIRVNGIAPGFVPTEVVMTALHTDEAALAKMADKIVPLKRLGTPDDMASAAIYLASDAGSWVTGQTITVAGGL
jgi:NAD(P)-dependent dehydrogenase (short-subunit alcohol dehydrogenase family)